MIAQALLTCMLAAALLYAWKEHRSVPIVGLLVALVAATGLYFVWLPGHASSIAAWAGIGRGADLILYGWGAFSLIALLNLHLKLKAQAEVVTRLARAMAVSNAQAYLAAAGSSRAGKRKAASGGFKSTPAAATSGQRRRASGA